MKNLIPLLFAGLCCLSASKASELIDPQKFISDKKDFCISDGSSVYVFLANNIFHLEPFDSESGRTIDGTWTYKSPCFYISGKWGGINFAGKGSHREMDIYVSHLESEPTDYTSWLLKNKHLKIYKSYF